MNLLRLARETACTGHPTGGTTAADGAGGRRGQPVRRAPGRLRSAQRGGRPPVDDRAQERAAGAA